MIVKVKYDETVSREGQVEIDDEEFMAYANDGGSHSYRSTGEALAAEPGLIKLFLEDQPDHVWQVANDPSCMGFDHTLTEADL